MLSAINLTSLWTYVNTTSQVTSVAFGGDDLSDLYVTTASVGDIPPPAGALFKVRKKCGNVVCCGVACRTLVWLL